MTDPSRPDDDPGVTRLTDPEPRADDPPRTGWESCKRRLWRLRRSCRTTAMQAAYLLCPQPQWLYIHTHMRAGSSLLTEIILDHPTCHGFGETQVAHNSHRRVARAAAEIHHKLRRLRPITRGLLVDKIVHDPFDTPAPDLLAQHARHSVFLTREPVATIASIIRLRDQPQSDTEKYLAERYSSLADLATRLADRVPLVYLTNADLIHRTDATLAFLSDALQFDPPLRENYTPSVGVGVQFAGDPSQYLRAGRVVRDRPRYLPPRDLLPETRQAYERCVQTLRDLCRTPPPPDTDAEPAD